MNKRRKGNEGPRILTIDIETAPLESYTWGLWQQNVGLNQIKTEWSILSYCAKWMGRSEIIYKDNRDQVDPRDDKHLLQGIWKLLNKADIVVSQNGIRFDLKKIRARLILEGHPPFLPVKQVDTLVEAKRQFAFTSNKLEWMSAKLTDEPKSIHKKFPGFELWAECLKGNVEAWDEMAKYNPTDVRGTEKLYLKLRPWIEGHPNVAQYYEGDATRCPKCGSLKVEAAGIHYTQTGEYTRYKCKCCGGFSHSRYTLNSTNRRKTLLSN